MTVWFFKQNKEILATLEPSDTRLSGQPNWKVLCLKTLPHLTLITLFFGSGFLRKT